VYEIGAGVHPSQPMGKAEHEPAVFVRQAGIEL
jgi:hypothetical protein